MCALLPLREEFGPRLALGAYVVVAALGILLVPDKEAALLYLFLGYYPVLRPRLERLRPRILGLFCKLLVFNASVLLLYWLLLHVFALSEVMESFAGLSRAMLAATLTMGNLVFFLTDRALEVLTLFYRLRVRKSSSLGPDAKKTSANRQTSFPFFSALLNPLAAHWQSPATHQLHE